MKNLIVVGICFIISGFGYNLVYADGEHGHHEKETIQTLKGEVVDMVCYLSHGESGMGPKHADCAKKCIESGLPVAIKAGDILYIAANKDHTSANKTLAQFAAKTITVTGKVVEQDGVKMVLIDTITPD